MCGSRSSVSVCLSSQRNPQVGRRAHKLEALMSLDCAVSQSDLKWLGSESKRAPQDSLLSLLKLCIKLDMRGKPFWVCFKKPTLKHILPPRSNVSNEPIRRKWAWLVKRSIYLLFVSVKLIIKNCSCRPIAFAPEGRIRVSVQTRT